MRQYFPAAPWPTSLKLVSLFGTVALLATAYFAFRVVPVASGFTHNFGIGVAMIPLVLLLCSFLYQVRGYSVSEDELYIERLFFVTSLSLSGLNRAWCEPLACKGSLRIFGNGGLFSFTGLYYNKKLGNFRLFATDISRTVMLQLPKRVVVVTPAEPHVFMNYLGQEFPGLKTTALERSK